jgi:hypothetical protein
MSSIAMRSPNRTAVLVIAAAMLAAMTAIASAESVTSERLSLRPLKEPAHCVGSGACPLVASPRVGHRRSTIPGVSNPDHGRPKVIVIGPPSTPATPGFRRFGGNYGIVGGP